MAALRHLRRNFYLGLLNSSFFGISDALIEPTLVLSWFVSQLSGSSFLIGALNPISISGVFLLQFFSSGYLQGQERRLLLYQQTALLRCVSIGLMYPALLLVHDTTTLLIVFYFLLIVYNLSTGPGVLSFMDVVGKTIPPARRGTFFGVRYLSWGATALLGSLVVGYMLDESHGWPFPTNFAVLFLISFVFASLAMGAFSLFFEPLEDRANERVGWREQLLRARKLLREDAAYVRFLAARLSLVGVEMTMPFYIVYANKQLMVPAGMVGTYLLISTGSALLSTALWGYISDRYGNRLLVWLTILLGLPAPVIALLVGAMHHRSGQGEVTLVLFGLVFAFVGAFRVALSIAHNNYLLDIAPAQERPIYIGFANTVVGMAMVLTVFSGLIVDLVGYGFLFALALAFSGLAGLFGVGLVEPRRRVAYV